MSEEKQEKMAPLTLTPAGENGAMEVAPIAIPSELFNYQPTTEDIQLPRFRLAQGLTPEVVEGIAKAGEWLIPGKPAVKNLTAVILGIRRTRAKWTMDDQKGIRQIDCSSPDAVFGHGDPGGDCNTCPMAKWTPNPKSGRNDPPACTLSYGYLMQTEEGDVGVYDASTRSANQVIGQLNAFYLQAGAGNVKITLGSQLISRGARRYYSPSLVRFDIIKGEEPVLELP